MSQPPEAVLGALDASAPVLPAPVPAALPAAPGVPGVPAVPAPGVVYAPRPPSRVLEFMRRQWRKLVTPTDKRPEDYQGHLVARIVNAGIDKGHEGASHEVMFGEAVNLAVDVVVTGGHGGSTPLGHVLNNGGELLWRKMDQAGKEPDKEPA